MSARVAVRLASSKEIAWVNSRYDEVGFVRSEISTEKIAIAEIDGEKVGLGRLVRITGDDAELGGMFVFEKFRGQGVAGKIVDLLLQQSKRYKHVFCIPFEHLREFYGRYGFREFELNISDVPLQVKEKHKWCIQNYKHNTLLLVLTNNHG